LTILIKEKDVPSIEYDKNAKAIYIKIIESSPENHSHTEELIPDMVMIDKDKDGNITGIEVLGIESDNC